MNAIGEITSVQWKSRHREKGKGDYEGTDAGFFEDIVF